MNPERILSEIKDLQTRHQQLKLDVLNFKQTLDSDIENIKNEVNRLTSRDNNTPIERPTKIEFPYIGHIKSCFIKKNGTPRQPSICPYARGELSIKYFNNPEHSLEGLQQFSHVWLMFAFHENGTMRARAKVKPPRLDGQRMGVFSTRSPHRPAPLGLTLAKLDKIVGGTLYLSGLDLIDGTPIIDLKPYIEQYDYPTGVIYSAPWIENPPIKELSVVFSPVADQQLDNLIYSKIRGGKDDDKDNKSGTKNGGTELKIGTISGTNIEGVKCSGSGMEIVVKRTRLLFMRSREELSHCISEILRADPRSTYRRGGGGDKQYLENVEVEEEGNEVVEKEDVGVEKVNVFSFPVDNVEVHIRVVDCVATVLSVKHTAYVNELWGEEMEEEGQKSRTKRRRRRRKKN